MRSKTCVITASGRRVCGTRTMRASGAAPTSGTLTNPESVVDWAALRRVFNANDGKLTAQQRRDLIRRVLEQDVDVAERYRAEAKKLRRPGPGGREYPSPATTVDGFAFFNHTRDQSRFPDLSHMIDFERMDDYRLLGSAQGVDEAYRKFRFRPFARGYTRHDNNA